jgi:hygromycin-B 7''-O-kinase
MIDEVRRILAHHRLDVNNIHQAPGFANAVWMTRDVVIRLNGGRFINAFGHEADVLQHLHGVVPVPQVITSGAREAGGEYIILERLRGQNLEDAWPFLPAESRRNVLVQLSGILAKIHALPIERWMTCEWFDLALHRHNAADAYHVSPQNAPWMIESAHKHRPDLADTLSHVSMFITDRMDLFGDSHDVFIHSDLHFRNLIVDGDRVTGIIDFEGSRPAPLDVELDMLVRWLTPLAEADSGNYGALLPALFDLYPALGNIQALLDRLGVMELLWMLVQAHHWHPGAVWMGDPGEEMRRVLEGAYRADLLQVLPVLARIQP